MTPYAYRMIEAASSNLTVATITRLLRGYDVDITDIVTPAPPLKRRSRGRPRAFPHHPEAAMEQQVSVGDIEAPTPPETSTAPTPPHRLVSVAVALPVGKFTTLRDFVVAVLRANPGGLTSPEIIRAAHDARRRRLQSNDVHLVLHSLLRSGHLQREGERGRYLYRLRGPTGTGTQLPDQEASE